MRQVFGTGISILIFSFSTFSIPAQTVFSLEKPPLYGTSESVNWIGPQEELKDTDILHYHAYLTLDDASEQMEGIVTILIKSQAQLLKRVDLHLHNLEIIDIFTRHGNLYFTRDGDLVGISLNQELRAGDTLRLTIHYRGSPTNDGFGGYFTNSNFIYTVGEGIHTNPPAMTHYWLPCKDVPWDKATLQMDIDVPGYLFAAANGVLIKVDSLSHPGRKIYSYSTRYPMAPYLFAIAVSKYQTFKEYFVSPENDSIEFIAYVPEALRPAAEIDFARWPDMMSVFSDRFGPYPFERYAMAVAPMQGAMEHQTMTTYSSFLITGDRRHESVVAHEFAHQWWGDWVTLTNWNEIWLNEGFASYSEVIFLETVWPPELIDTYLQNKALSYFDEVKRRGHFSLANPSYFWGGTVYEKGAWVLHMLRQQVGNETFWRILKEYGRGYAYSNATIPDFIAVVNRVTGEDLQWFFDQWVYAAGYPKLNINWSSSQQGENNYRIDLTIRQVQDIEVIFRLPLEIALVLPSDTLLRKIQIDSRTTQTTFTVPEPPITIVADPHHKILLQVNYFVGRTPLKTVLRQNFPNPFARSLSNPYTTIEFSIYRDLTPVEIKIYNLAGQEVITLVHDTYSIGRHMIHWNGRNNQGTPAPSGIYFCVLKTPTEHLRRKVILLQNR